MLLDWEDEISTKRLISHKSIHTFNRIPINIQSPISQHDHKVVLTITERNGESILTGNPPKKEQLVKYMKVYSTPLVSKNAKDKFSKRLAKNLK